MSPRRGPGARGGWGVALLLVTACDWGPATPAATAPTDSTPVAAGETTRVVLPGFLPNVPVIALNVMAARPTAEAVGLSLFAGRDGDATVTLADDGRTFARRLVANVQSTVEIGGLRPDRRYAYTVTAGGVTRSGAFRTARGPGTAFRFALQADSHLDTNTAPRVYANTLDNIVSDSVDFLVDLGDTFMSDKLPDFRAGAPMYYAQRHYLGIVGAQAPVFLVQGNHDAESAWDPANAAWAADMRGRHFPPVQADAFYASSQPVANHYAWTWGDALFVVLDPYGATAPKPAGSNAGWGWTLGRAQYDWLAATLAGSRARYVFVFLHHLVGGNGAEARGGAEASVWYEWGGANADGTPGFAARRPGWGRPIHDLLRQHGVSAVFHGHDHLYVHQVRDGIHYQEVPQPGFPREGATASAADYGYLSGTLQSSSGHLRVTVTPAKATVEYVRSRLTAGNRGLVDAYDVAPRPTPPAPPR